MLIFNHTCAKWRGGEWSSLWGCHSNFQQLCGCMAVFIFYNFVMIFCEVLSGTSTWFFRYSQIFSKIPKIREKFKKPTQPSQNYRSENVITQLIAKKNKAMCRWFLLLNSKKIPTCTCMISTIFWTLAISCPKKNLFPWICLFVVFFHWTLEL